MSDYDVLINYSLTETKDADNFEETQHRCEQASGA